MERNNNGSGFFHAALAALALCACQSSPVEFYGHTAGEVFLGYDLERLVIVARSEGQVQLRPSQAPLLPLRLIVWSEPVVIVHGPDGFRARYEPGEKLPPEASAIVSDVWTLEEILLSGLHLSD